MRESVRDINLWDKYELAEIGEKMDGLYTGFNINYENAFEKIVSGDIVGALSLVVDGVIKGLSNEVLSMKEMVVMILVIGIASALLSHFISAFDNYQIADVSFYFSFLLLLTVLMKGFTQMALLTETILSNIVGFIQIFIPTYLFVVGLSTGPTSAMVSYQLLMILILLIENLLSAFLLPFIYSYILLSVINSIWVEEKLGLLIEFMHKSIGVMLKMSLGVITGISLLQNMITPVVDKLKNTAIQKTISAIPGVGNLADGVMDIVLGTTVLLKNSIGVFLVILLLGMCVIPLVKIGLISILLKFSAAMLGVISDKRITNCTNKVGEGGVLLWKLSFTGMLLFLIVIALASYGMGRGM